MKKRALCGVLLVTVLGFGFAQEIELPEPAFNGAAPEQSPAPLSAPLLKDLSYFWDTNPQNPSGTDLTPIAVLAAAGDSDAQLIPREIRNNQYYRESLRLKDLAKKSFDEGDYDASTNYAAESMRYAQLSDEYVALQLKIRETDMAIAAARDRISWAGSKGIDKTYPNQFKDAQGYYDEAMRLRQAEDWDPAIVSAKKVLFVLADTTETLPLPAQYKVRTWATEKDCLWNIAGYSWIYGDAFEWKRLYEANKSKMPEANNPDLIHPGTILDIPSIRGENRQDLWYAGRSYNPLPPK